MRTSFLRVLCCLTAVISCGRGARAVGTEPAALAGSPAAATPQGNASAADLDFFEKKVRPLLADRCYKCHAAGGEKIKGNLRLDAAEFWLKGGDAGPAVVPADPDKSLLIEAVRYKNPDLEMPPKGKLSDDEVATLVKWVQMGAPAPKTDAAAAAPAPGKRVIDLAAERKHWAYQPVRQQAPPAVKDGRWAKTDIDRFILAKLESQDLRPTTDADPATLVRRVYFDLIGLPPTPEQIDAYLADKSPARYAVLVDRLLASPQFGERWGRHWLDVARFGESLTLRGFVIGDAWRYRDYVIDSFNRDRPFDQFVMQQVAGDLMPAPTLEEKRQQVVATAFLAIGNTNLEEQDKKQLEMDVVDEQIDTVGRAFLAQTIGCARCHDHKFDPIPTKDYYALAGILRSTQALEHSNVSKWLSVPLPVEADREEVLRKHEFEVSVLQEQIKEAKAAAAKAAPKGKKPTGATIAVESLPGMVVDDAQAKRVGTWKESTTVKPYIGVGYLTDDGKKDEQKTLTFGFEVPETGKYDVRFAYTPGANRATNASVVVFSPDTVKTVVVNEQEAPADGSFVPLGRYTFEKNGQAFVIVSNEGANGHVVADAVQFLPADADPDATPVTAPAAAAAVAAKAGGAPAVAAADAAPKAPRVPDRVKQLEAQLKKLTDAGPHRETVVSVREGKEMGDTRVNVRGSVHTLGDSVPRGFLQVVSPAKPQPIPETESGRRQLGLWLVDPGNPLPARVMANRVWHWLMGQGLVRTTDNFGTTGELPSHPELLDYLATQLVENDWSIKRLIRQVVLSRTYQLSSTAGDRAKAADPENRLAGRMNHRRLDAECIRDAMLAISGRLSTGGGGPTFSPGLKSDFGYKQADGTHRSVYLPVFRNALPELFEVFDFADPSVSNGRRNVSTVAPQALFLLNHPFVTEQAAAAGGALVADVTLNDDTARVRRAYRSALGREPTPRETDVATAFVKDAGGGDAAATEDAWAQLFHALFASLDFRYVR